MPQLDTSKTTNELVRVQIEGKLRCLSDLHVGNSERLLLDERDLETKIASDTGYYNAICSDHAGLPYIPGSTLRGSLHSFLDGSDERVEDLFGVEDSSGPIAARLAGLLTVRDATIITDDEPIPALCRLPYWSDKRKTFLAHGIGRNPSTGTVAPGRLFLHEYVPRGSMFRLNLSINAFRLQGKQPMFIDSAQIELLLCLLQRWNTEDGGAIGRSRNKGAGRISWETISIKGVDRQSLNDWMNDETLNLPFPSGSVVRVEPVESTDRAIKSRGLLPFHISMCAHSPLLINEPGFVSGESGQPSLVFQQRENHAFIPGTTLGGAARGRCRKILASMLAHKAEAGYNQSAIRMAIGMRAETLVSEVFGSQDKAGMIQFAPLYSSGADALDKHPQFFNAIDRFTGGVMATALFNVVASAAQIFTHTPPDDKTTQTRDPVCSIDLRLAPEGDWWKGLMLLLARDALDETIPLGWGSSKGYGSVSYAITWGGLTVKDWYSVTQLDNEHLESKNFGVWLEALDNVVQKSADGILEGLSREIPETAY